MKFRLLRAFAAVLLATALLPVAQASALQDPSPYCRAYVSIPYAIGEAPAGGGHYTLTVEGDATISCNGPAAVSVTPVLHYTTNPCQGGCGAKTGATFYCGSSCEVDVTFTRNLYCGYHYTFQDYTQLTGTWSGGGVSGKFTQIGGKSSGSSYNPPGVC